MTKETFEAIRRIADGMRAREPAMADLIDSAACVIVASQNPATSGRLLAIDLEYLDRSLERMAKEEQR